jgi:hypothetical protein
MTTLLLNKKVHEIQLTTFGFEPTIYMRRLFTEQESIELIMYTFTEDYQLLIELWITNFLKDSFSTQIMNILELNNH